MISFYLAMFFLPAAIISTAIFIAYLQKQGKG
jgi:hypothetical protein